MTYLKCALVGVLAGVAAAIVLPIAGVFLAFRSIEATGAGALGSVSVGMPTMLLFWLIGFAVGFIVMLRRQRRRSTP